MVPIIVAALKLRGFAVALIVASAQGFPWNAHMVALKSITIPKVRPATMEPIIVAIRILHGFAVAFCHSKGGNHNSKRAGWASSSVSLLSEILM